MKDANIKTEEIKTKVAWRFPPGDRWKPMDDQSIILESLTDCLEYVYQKNNDTKFYIDARAGFVYSVESVEVVVEPEPDKRWSLYGEY